MFSCVGRWHCHLNVSPMSTDVLGIAASQCRRWHAMYKRTALLPRKRWYRRLYPFRLKRLFVYKPEKTWPITAYLSIKNFIHKKCVERKTARLFSFEQPTPFLFIHTTQKRHHSSNLTRREYFLFKVNV